MNRMDAKFPSTQSNNRGKENTKIKNEMKQEKLEWMRKSAVVIFDDHKI